MDDFYREEFHRRFLEQKYLSHLGRCVSGILHDDDLPQELCFLYIARFIDYTDELLGGVASSDPAPGIIEYYQQFNDLARRDITDLSELKHRHSLREYPNRVNQLLKHNSQLFLSHEYDHQDGYEPTLRELKRAFERCRDR
jgi:hypothetical protein